MRHLLALFIVFIFPLYATTPYNLEGIKALNILILDDNDVLTPAFEARLKERIKKRMDTIGIVSVKEDVGAISVSVRALEVQKEWVIHVCLSVGEEALVKRGDKEVVSYVKTYVYDDMVHTKFPELEVQSVVMEYLLDEFLEQYEEDNEE